jgi:hypothetical protein
MGLEQEFHAELEGTVEAARVRDYFPAIFQQMLAEHGGVETAKRLLAVDEPQVGLFRLYELNLLANSMEAVVIKEKYKELFTLEEIEIARRRLEELDFFKNNPSR